jgi:uncharacterized protein involved in exopolysaccharide biosynthesis
MMRPLYTSEARILLQNDESVFTRPASDRGLDFQPAALDEQAAQSQVQRLTSRDLAVEVVKALDLTNNPDFAKDARGGPIKRFLNRIGLRLGSPKSGEEKATPISSGSARPSSSKPKMRPPGSARRSKSCASSSARPRLSAIFWTPTLPTIAT